MESMHLAISKALGFKVGIIKDLKESEEIVSIMEIYSSLL